MYRHTCSPRILSRTLPRRCIRDRIIYRVALSSLTRCIVSLRFSPGCSRCARDSYSLVVVCRCWMFRDLDDSLIILPILYVLLAVGRKQQHVNFRLMHPILPLSLIPIALFIQRAKRSINRGSSVKFNYRRESLITGDAASFVHRVEVIPLRRNSSSRHDRSFIKYLEAARKLSFIRRRVQSK